MVCRADRKAGSSTHVLNAGLDGTADALIPHALIDISDRQSALTVSGPLAADVLNTGCPLDLDIHAFPVGMCTRTLMAKAEVILWRTTPDTFRMECQRSFADYLAASY